MRNYKAAVEGLMKSCPQMTRYSRGSNTSHYYEPEEEPYHGSQNESMAMYPLEKSIFNPDLFS